VRARKRIAGLGPRGRPYHARVTALSFARLARFVGACAIGAIAVGSTQVTRVARAADVAPAPITVPIPKVAIGFSKLIVRLEQRSEIGVVGDDHAVRILERMRARGFQAVGAENLVFGKDESAKAEYQIGGTVRELECARHDPGMRCRIAVEWQVLDVRRDAVVYTVVNRASVFDDAEVNNERMGGTLLLAAVDRLLERDEFRRVLVPHGAPVAPTDAKFATATLAKCPPAKKLPGGSEDLLRATVVVKVPDGFGSGFFVGPEGLVLTAAHVLEGGAVRLRLREGDELDAVAVRIARSADVALLRTTKPLTGHACLPLREAEPPIGADLYAAGAPARLDLAFSITRGIVSALPTIDGRKRLQTDAPLSPGHSGGPLADADGAVVGVVSFKLVDRKVEGLGFGVPMREALDALGLRLGEATDASLRTELATVTSAPTTTTVTPFHDTPDPVPTLDPEGDQRRVAEAEQARQDAERRAHEAEMEQAEKAREAERDRRTPGWIPVARWSGLAAALVGCAAVGYSASAYDDGSLTMRGARNMRIVNTLGWVGVGLGGSAFVMSYVLRPPLPPATATAPPTGATTLRVGLGGVLLEGSF
jgi:S1-C subfamily serine protease